MSKFLDSTGLSRLVENIKNKFQKKKTHCKLWDNGGYWTITIDNNNDYYIVRDGADLYEVLKDKLDNLTFDIEFANNYLLYNVNYNTYKDSDGSINIMLTGLTYSSYDEPLTDIIKVGIWLYEDTEGDCIISKGDDIEINNLNIINNLNKSGDGTKFLANDGEYKRIADTYYSFDFTNEEYYKFQGADIIDEYDLKKKADVIRLYNSLKADIGKPTFARVITDDIDGYSNDGFSNVIIEENDEDGLYVTFNIVDFLADGTDTDNMILAKKTMDINTEYGFCTIYDSHVIRLTTGGSGMLVLNDKGEYSINDTIFIFNPEEGYIETVNPNDNSTQDNFSLNTVSEMKDFFNIFNRCYNRGSIIKFKIIHNNYKNIVIPHIISDYNGSYTIICTFMYDNNPDDNDVIICKTSFDFNKNGSCVYYGIEEYEINLNNLFMVGYLDDTGNGDKFLTDDGSYVNTSRLITFEAENGSLNAEQTDAIEEGYLRNLPIYVLYSGIKMLVNGIQKLGDIYSLSCRHDNSTFSITMNLDDNSYEISSISE